mmetsp:Transcript_29830/g.36554  ORF Transcript_29830/g.36554 Transcript_29830/m.36554 type:complete len:326 (+) Transcript_29830:7-984(+)
MAQPGTLSPGVLARISGLTKGNGLNGELGSLLCLTETGRWLVNSRGRTVAIQSENLSPAADEVPEMFRRKVAASVAITAHIFLELARSGGTRQLTTSTVPVLLLAWALATLLGSRWLYYPLISYKPVPGLWDLGRAPPSQGFLRLGSAICALLLTSIVRIHQNLILKPVFAESLQFDHAMMCAEAGYLAALGLTCQSMFTYSTSPASIPGFLRSFGVVAFYIGSAWHAKLFWQISPEFFHSSLAQSAVFSLAVAVRRLFIICAPLILPNAFLTVPAFQLQGLTGHNHTFRELMRSSSAVFQWVAMLYFMLYFSTYAVDFWIAFEY